MFKNVISVFLVLCILITAAGCNGGATTASSSQPSSEAPSSSSEDTSSGESSQAGSASRPSYIGSGDMAGVKEPVNGESISGSVWSDPHNYTIIFPQGDTAAKEAAMRIQKFFTANFDASLPVVSDANAEVPFEILVGKTNREKSDKSIKQNDYKVSTKGVNLVFDGGHQASLDQAVQLFVEKAPKNSAEAAISGSLTNFQTRMLGKYDYVWGDEFVTKELDFTRWTLSAKMGGTETIKVHSGRETIDMADGNLVLRAVKSANKAKTEYLVPTSVVTQWNMMYTYGYCEIRAKVPNAIGVWPSFWTQSNTGVGKRSCFNYFVEVDIFEVFGDPDGKIIPNLHKWYKESVYNYAEIHKQYDKDGNPIMHTVTGSYGKNVPLADAGTTYHTYGYEWTPTEMSMYVDGVKYITYDITDCFDKSGEMKGFHDPQFLIFNNHVFAKDASYKPNLIENNESALPAEYCIDYFRLYQKKGEGKIWTDSDVYKTYPERS